MRRTLLLCPVLIAGLAGCMSSDPGDTSADAHNTGNNGEVIAALEESGSDLSKPHPVDFYIYFDERSDADAAAKSLAAKGYDAEVDPEQVDTEWLLIASKESTMSEAKIDALEAEIVAVAEPANGVYEGWETEIVE